MKTFSPGVNPKLPLQWQLLDERDETQPIKPYGQTIPKLLHDVRVFRLDFSPISRPVLDYIISFFADNRGAPFLWRPPLRITDPLGVAPILDSLVLAGAPAGARTYTVGYTWRNTTDATESRLSLTDELTVAGGSVLTVRTPVFPVGVDAAGIYAEESPATPTFQAEASARDWQEDISGLTPGVVEAPAESNLQPLQTYTKTGPLSPVKARARHYGVTLNLIEHL